MPLSQLDLINQLLALNTPDSPFRVASEGNAVTAVWNLVDAKWIELYAKASMKETYQITLTLEEPSHQVSYQEKTGQVTWKAGLPEISFSAQHFQGKTISFHKEVAYGLKENLQPGQLYQIDFSTNRIKKPIFEIIEKAGWTLKRSFFEKLLGV